MRENRNNRLTEVLAWLGIPQKEQQNFLIRLALFWILMTAILVIESNQILNNITVGKASPYTVICPKNLIIENKAETEVLKNNARNNEPPVYESKPLANEQMLDNFEANLTILTKFYEKFQDKANNKSAKELIPLYFPENFILSEARLIQISTFKEKHFESLKTKVRNNFVSLIQRQIVEENLPDLRKEISSTASRIWGESQNFKQIFDEILQNSIYANCYLDEEKTRLRKEEAAKKIQPVIKEYQKGQRIVSEGDIVTEEIYSIFNEIQSKLKRNVFLSILGSMLLMSLAIGINLAYIRTQDPSVFLDTDQYKLIGALSFVFFLIVKVIYGISEDFNEKYLLILLSPMATFILLLSSRFGNVKIVYFHAFWMGLLSLLVGGDNENYIVALLIGAIGGVLSWNITYDNTNENMRTKIARTGLNLGITTFFSILAISLIDSEDVSANSVYKILGYSFCGLINGLMSGVITNGVLPYIEEKFSFATPTKLLELTSEENPLLKRLATEAPGTYQHSKSVADLAAQAASAVDADVLLTKVCALYHDIGKIKRPEYYTENQHGENPHDEKKPTMSALIIATHVKDGAEIARDNDIPTRVIDIMSQHHGKSLIEYFYNKQKELTPDRVDDSQFRYLGPKPQSKEAAILLLADAVEASSRSLDDLNPEKIKAHIKKIVDHKMQKDDNQLEETNLTLRDIDLIEDAFVKVLISANHKRIKYQNQLKEEAAAKAAVKAAEAEAKALSETLSVEASAMQEVKPETGK